MILASQANDVLVAVGFDGKQLFETKNRGNAKYIPDNTDKVFVTGVKSGLVDLRTSEYDYLVECHENVTAFAFHAISDIVACGSDDSSWSLHDTK